ncbi:hypothetical protein SM168_17905 [Acinetobacter baumannii]|nr:hypothetical protein [Acinetobacter baumannii]AMO42485.1 hypothetical protein A0J50_18295 [Acinetobacter sp. DUT-2]USQ63241.1 hypothetical protein C7A15_20245 [Acinetobacter pittii]WDM41664.1 hypothetical protein KNV99_20270 [Acinetobacter nosocomialis]EGY5284730.1 hypothetical protein [Acinetobacter baumannii]EIB6746534.1 hypothetical protein [Acinetobacter baumannii]
MFFDPKLNLFKSDAYIFMQQSHAKEACKSFGIDALNSITTNRNVYDDADENGLSVFEVNSDPKAKAEIESIAREFLGV